MNYDLHSHSIASDGTLTPTSLVDEAVKAGVTHLALTDHDTIAGLAEARRAADKQP
ncbi:MAG TPA: PHP domain-containing protein, partial [Gammaproteobacteria bacterium]